MGARTSIEWTEASWNPLRGCTRVSEGCRHCYAESVAGRFSGPGLPYEGLATLVERPDGSHEGRWTGKVDFVEKHLRDPLRWRKPRRIFVNSMSDLFHESVPDSWIDRIFAVMALSPNHTFQVLTKRPERAAAYLASDRWKGIALAIFNGEVGDVPVEHGYYWTDGDACSVQWPLPNVWLGVSVEDQATADVRIPILLQTQAAVRWISAEPLLGPIDLRLPAPDGDGDCSVCGLSLDEDHECPPGFRSGAGLDWVVVGGESGPRARFFDLEWARSLIRQCGSADVPIFVKQLGSQLGLRDVKGGDPTEWPSDLRVRRWPN